MKKLTKLLILLGVLLGGLVTAPLWAGCDLRGELCSLKCQLRNLTSDLGEVACKAGCAAEKGACLAGRGSDAVGQWFKGNK